MTILGLAAIWVRRSTYARDGRVALVAGLVIFAAGIAELATGWIFQPEPGEGEPYSEPTRITR